MKSQKNIIVAMKMLLLTARKKWSDNMIKIEGGSTAGKIFWSNFEAFQFKHGLYIADIARLIYNRTEYGHNRKSSDGISSNLSQLLREKNNPNNTIANAILYVMSHVEKKEITYSDVYTKNFFRKKG